MTDPSSPKPPSRALDRSSLERVLARAAELQSGTGETRRRVHRGTAARAGAEVGLSPQNLRQALAEERTRSIVPDEERGCRGKPVRTEPRARGAHGSWESERGARHGRRVDAAAGAADRQATSRRPHRLGASPGLPRRHQASVQGWRPRLRAVACVRGVRDGDFRGRRRASQVGLDADFRTSRRSLGATNSGDVTRRRIGYGVAVCHGRHGGRCCGAGVDRSGDRYRWGARTIRGGRDAGAIGARAAARSARARGVWTTRTGVVARRDRRGRDGVTAATVLALIPSAAMDLADRR